MTEKNVSGLRDHKLKKGSLLTPFNEKLGNKLTLSSWAKDRLPEYLWLGLMLKYYGRELGFEKAGRILKEISSSNISLSTPRLSEIFELSESDQETLYSIILSNIAKEVVAPLTAIYRFKNHPIFYKTFSINSLSIEERIQILSEVVEIYYQHQSDEATDLRYLALSLMGFNNQLVISTEASGTIEALNNYPYTDHNEEKMKWYRPTVRSTEISMTFSDRDTKFSDEFWKELGMMTTCEPFRLEFPENETDYSEFITESSKALEHVQYSNKEKSLGDDKFNVVIGSITYALTIFTEIYEKSLGNGILGRHGMRTIIEVYVMLKYLQSREIEQPSIWEEYKLYGISKYKLILLKAREREDTSSHFSLPVLDSLVNEIRWEEFIDVDLKYFDNQRIRDKSIDAGEKDLYDLYYDYDSSFVHGLWGAVRESCMLHCNKPNHHFHTVPDLYNNQNLPDVLSDGFNILIRMYTFFSLLYDMPDWFVIKYEISIS